VTVTLVAAVAANGVIGADGGLPWHLPEDFAHFKRLTLGHPMIMGRATFESIGRPLPGRTSIVVTRNPDWAAPSSEDAVVEVASSLASAVERAREIDDDVFVIGGGQVYAEALSADLVDLMVVTRVSASPDGDTSFPSIDWERWKPAVHIPYPADGERPGFDIVTYERA
jgi:dihydrofolate reductase